MGLCPVTAQLSEDEIKFFETKIRPVLAEHCYECHGKDPKNIESDLVLTTAEGIRKGGMFGPVVFPGEPDRSPLIQAIRHTDPNLQMPQAYKLSHEIIRDFEEWVARGAFDPRDDSNYEPNAIPSPSGDDDFSEGRKQAEISTIEHSSKGELQ